MHNSCTLLLLLLPTFNSANCLWRALCSAPFGPSVLCSALFTQRWLQLAAHCDDYLFTYRLLPAFGFGFAFCLLPFGFGALCADFSISTLFAHCPVRAPKGTCELSRSGAADQWKSARRQSDLRNECKMSSSKWNARLNWEQVV